MAERIMMKSLEDNFRDWESGVFGFGYGSGEQYTTAALKTFFDLLKDRHSYDYAALEEKLTPTVAWLMINILCHADIIEYGTSPRYGWMTKKGAALEGFIAARSTDDLLELLNYDQDYCVCGPDYCNCGPTGYEEGRVCQNPFWQDNPPPEPTP